MTGALTALAGLRLADAVAPRGRDLLLFDALHRTLERLDVDLLDRVPAFVSLPLDLERPPELAALLGQVLWLELALATSLALGAALLMRGRPADGRLATLVRGVVVATAAAPGCFVLGQALIHVEHALPYYATGIAFAAGVGAISATLLGGGRAVRTAATAAGLSVFGIAIALILPLRAVLAVPDAAVGAADTGLPSILLVSIDSLRADHVHAYGYPRETTPVIDRLAADGVLFENAIAASSWTLPSHVTMLTGLAPEAHGVFVTDRRLALGTLTLPEVLQGAGYRTAGFVSGPYLESRYGYSQGFDHYDDFHLVAESDAASHRGVTSPALVALVDAWIDRWADADREQPFFLFVHMWDVHYDFTPPPPYDTMFDPGYKGTITGDDFEVGDEVRLGMPDRDLAHVVALYDGEIRYTDEHLGRLLDRLRELGVLDDTIVVVTSDHGEEFFEHGHKGHRKNLYDETIRVPLVIRYPKQIAGGLRVARPVRGMDVPRTLLDLAGIEPPAGFADRGVALLAEPALETPAFSHLHGAFEAVQTETHKLIKRIGEPDGVELYDLRKDPGESENLVDQQPEVAAALDEELRAWREGSGSGAAPEAALDEEHLERLRALGYVE